MNRAIVVQQRSASTCQAETIGRRVASIGARLDDIDHQRLSGAPLEAGSRAREEAELVDQRDVLLAQLEWAAPMTLAGVYVQLLQLRSLVGDLASGDVACSPEFTRRLARLVNSAAEATERLAALDGREFGKADLWCEPTEFFSTRAAA